MIACEIADRMLDHTIRHWNSIPERETTVEQALLYMRNGLVRWTDVSNAMIRRKDIPPEVAELMRRIIDRMKNDAIELRKDSKVPTKAINDFIDACINSESSYALMEKMRRNTI